MSKAVKWIAGGLGVIVVVVGAGAFVGWYFSGGSPVPGPGQNPGRAPTVSNDQPVALEFPPMVSQQPEKAPPGVSPQVALRPSFNTNVPTGWEDKIDDVLGSEADDKEKTQELFILFPNMPTDIQVEAAQHLSNLVGDADYPQLARLLADPGTAEPVLDVLMADALNRPNSLKLPVLLQVASAAGNPKADEAKELLQLYLDEDDGADWPKWQARMQQWLKENPD